MSRDLQPLQDFFWIANCLFNEVKRWMWKPFKKAVYQFISGTSWAMTKAAPGGPGGPGGSGGAGPSSNWAQLKKTLPLPSPKSPNGTTKPNVKVVKIPPKSIIDKGKSRAVPSAASAGPKSTLSGVARFLPKDPTAPGPSSLPERSLDGDNLGVTLLPLPDQTPLLVELREMIAGRGALNGAAKAPGNYVAIDCEMVGLGPGGSESALARVSLVNFHGHVLLDTFVMPRETVTDWRTWVSGVRAPDLVGAPSFEEVQKKVAAIVEGRIVIGHAIQNDLRILLLSHPGPLVRDTQKYKPLRDKAKTKFPGLKKLAALELGVEIQGGAHSSITDARATMALYRLHKTAWEQSLRGQTEAYRQKVSKGKGETTAEGAGKRKRSEGDDPDSAEGAANGKTSTGGGGGGGTGRKGVSMGIGMVIHRKNGDVKGGTPKRAKVAPLTSSGNGGGGSASASGGGAGGGKWWEQSAS